MMTMMWMLMMMTMMMITESIEMRVKGVMGSHCIG